MIQRLIPGEATLVAPEQEAGGNQASAAEEAAGLAAEATRRAESRRLLPADLEEIAELAGLGTPQGPGLELGRGTRKLLEGIGRLGANRAGDPSAYVRDPDSAGGLPSFVLGDPADPDGRITVTADGLLEATKTKRTQKKAKKGQPAPAPVVTHTTGVFDLQGSKVKLKEGANVGELFLSQATSAVETEAQNRVLGELRGDETLVAGGHPSAGRLTIGELVAEAASGVYTQRSTIGSGANARQSDLLKKVMGAFDQVRAEFEAWKPPAAPDSGVLVPDHQTLARQFAAKLQPGLFLTAAAAQSELDQATAAQATAETDAKGAKDALTALKARTGVPKEEKAAHTQAIKDAQARKTAADAAVTAAKKLVKNRKARVDGLVAERDKFATTIAWILDPAHTTESRAGKTVGALCNVISYYLYGKAIGVVPADMDFQDYYLDEVKAGRIRYYEGTSQKGVFWGEGSTEWVAERNLKRMDDTEGPVDSLAHPSRAEELRTFLASGANVALSHQDLENTPPVAAHHFMLIVKGPDGVWRNMDHTSSSFRRRGAITDWSRVFRVEADATLVAEAKAKLGPVPAAP